MPIPDEVKEEIAARFRASYIQDRAGDGVRDLAAYLADLPPEHQDLIAAEYVAMRGIALAPEPDSLDSSRSSRLSEPGDDVIGPYKIVRELGRGGQATVYLAEDLRLRRQVALKVLDSGFTSNRTAFERFRREAAITSKLDHPGICAVHEAGEDRGVLWIAMRYVEGESLARKIASRREGKGEDDPAAAGPSPDSVTGPRTWGEVTRLLKVFEDAARALHAAHEAGVVHRDIKPGNLIVTKEGDPVILDFGLAQELDGDHPAVTVTGDMMGTPAYMSPEQLTAQRIKLDRRTDVYSLGISLFECLTLRRPFEAPTREGLYQAIMTKEPPDLRRLNPEIPADLRVVVASAIEKDRDRRYQTALDLAEELRRVRMHEPIVARPVGPLVRLQRWAQRHPALATAIGGLFLVLTVGLAVALFLLVQRDRALAEVTTERDAKNTALNQVTTERNEKQAALSEKTAALTEKAAALTDYDRLGDFSRLQRLQAEADNLWPAEPSKVPAMKTWVNQGAELEKRLTAHREARDRLRASAGCSPYTNEDRAADLGKHAAEQDQVAKLRSERERVVAAVSAAESRAASQPADSRDAIVHERMTWKFESSADQFKHDTTAKLVTDLTAFVDPDPRKGLLADVHSRLSFAETVEHETIGRHETKWADAIRSISDRTECPKYNGLEIKAQLGLIPIGKDPASGLWEFAHLQTTAPGADPIPKRDKDGRLFATESMGLVFVLIPGGTFRMGAIKGGEDQAPTDPNIDAEAIGEASPITEVALDPFFISKYEMTQGQWQRLVGKNPSQFGPGINVGGKVVDLRNPVEQVSWDDCDQWLGRLGLTLPTEAQWEYAARGGTTTPRWTGLGTDGLEKAANLADAVCRQNGGPPSWKYESWNDGYPLHAPVGSFTANPYGLHDVLGNVWEWCQDRYGGYGSTARQGDGLRSPAGYGSRVNRGGSFSHDASDAKSALRFTAPPWIGIMNLGTRPARSVSNP